MGSRETPIPVQLTATRLPIPLVELHPKQAERRAVRQDGKKVVVKVELPYVGENNENNGDLGMDRSAIEMVREAKFRFALFGDARHTRGLLDCIGWGDAIPFTDRGIRGLYALRRGDTAIIWATHGLHTNIDMFLYTFAFQLATAVIVFDSAECGGVKSLMEKVCKHLCEHISVLATPSSPEGPYCAAVASVRAHSTRSEAATFEALVERAEAFASDENIDIFDMA